MKKLLDAITGITSPTKTRSEPINLETLSDEELERRCGSDEYDFDLERPMREAARAERERRRVAAAERAVRRRYEDEER